MLIFKPVCTDKGCLSNMYSCEINTATAAGTLRKKEVGLLDIPIYIHIIHAWL